MNGTAKSIRVATLRWWCSLLCAAALGGCGGGGGDNTPQPASAGFELRLGSASVPVRQDSSGLLRVRVERQAGFTGVVELTLANAPTGVNASAVVVEALEDEAMLPLRFSAEAPLGALGVTVTGKSGAMTATITLQLDVQAPQPNSQQLIQTALEASQIDLGTSLLYRAYAAFGDSRLPAAYIGSGPAEEDLALFTDIENARPTLPQAILDQLQPFLVRPDDPLSVFNAGQPTSRERPTVLPSAGRCAGGAREWITERSSNHPVRAWALCLGTQPSNERAQNDLFRVIDVVDKAYDEMVASMGPAKPDLWGDEAIDVYVVPGQVHAPRPGETALVQYVVGGDRGAAWPQQPFAGRSSSAFVMMPTWRLAQADYQLTLIHELFHVLQFAHNYALDHWFVEASATWGSVHFNRVAQIRPPQNENLHKERFGNFQASGHSLLSTAGNDPYRSYIYPMFIEQERNASKISDAWQQFANATTPEQATAVLDFLLPFKDNFRNFAVRNVNEALLPGDPVPEARRYKKVDPPFPDGQFLPRMTAGDLVANQQLTRPTEIAALQAKYLQFTVDRDSGIQSVEFDFTGINGRAHLNVDALIRNPGGWFTKPVSLDGEPKPIFCFDLGPSNETVRGSFVELRLVLSNHGHLASNQVSGTLRVHPSRGGCAGWAGEIRWSNLSDVPGLGRTDASTIASVTFAVDENPPGGSTLGVVPYKVSRGHLRYHVSQTFPTCSQVATAEVEMNPDAASGPGATIASLATFSTNGMPQYGAFSGATFGTIIVTGNCTPDGSHTSVVHENRLIPWWSDPTGRPAYDLKENGTLMQEDVSVQSDHGGVRSQWTLRKVGK